MEINGVAHTVLTVSDFDAARRFYTPVAAFLGLRPVFEGQNFVYYIGGRTAVAIQRCTPEHRGLQFDQGRIGLHHLCFRARSREDVDAAGAFLETNLPRIGGRLVHGPEEGGWAPGYYSVLFEDPDGIRLEVNHVPGRGVFAPGAAFDPSGTYD